MTKRTSVFIVGNRVTKGRVALGYSQGELLEIYLAAYHRLADRDQRVTRKLDPVPH